MASTNHRVWSWIGKTRRHRVEFSHNTVTGAQLLLVDGDVYHKTSYKYRLTGCLFWTLDDQLCELYVICEDMGPLRYALTLDGKEATSADEGPITRWRVDCGGGTSCDVEFQHRTMDILVDSMKVEAEGDFLEEGEGSQYRFSIPQPTSAAADAAKECRLVVQPALEKTSKALRTTLLVDDALVAPSSDSSAVSSSGPMSPAASSSGSSKPSAGAGAALIRSDSSAASAGKMPEPVPDAKGVLRFQVGKGFTSAGDASTV